MDVPPEAAEPVGAVFLPISQVAGSVNIIQVVPVPALGTNPVVLTCE